GGGHGDGDDLRRRLRQPHPLRCAAAGQRPADGAGGGEDRGVRRQGQRLVRGIAHPGGDRSAAADPPQRQVRQAPQVLTASGLVGAAEAAMALSRLPPLPQECLVCQGRYRSLSSVWRERMGIARPSNQTWSAVALTSSGSPFHSTRSARMPGAMLPNCPATPSTCAGTVVSPARPASHGSPLATALPASLRTVRALCEASPDWLKPTRTPAACSRAAFSMVAPRVSKLPGRLASGSTNTGTFAAASRGATAQASAPPEIATRSPWRLLQRSSCTMSAARSTSAIHRPSPSR